MTVPYKRAKGEWVTGQTLYMWPDYPTKIPWGVPVGRSVELYTAPDKLGKLSIKILHRVPSGDVLTYERLILREDWEKSSMVKLVGKR